MTTNWHYDTASIELITPTPPAAVPTTQRRDAPKIRTYELIGRNEEPFEIRGRLLGYASSYRDDHNHQAEFAVLGTRCSACRWFEVRIFTVEAEYPCDDDWECTCGAEDSAKIEPHTDDCGWEPPRAHYLVLTYGRTNVPGELNKRRAEWTDSAFDVLAALVQRRSNEIFLPATSDRALAKAAAWDDGIKEAYVNRAVV